MTDQFTSKMALRIMPFLSKKGNRVAKGAIEFDNFLDCGHCLFVGFTICDDSERGLFVMFPAATNVGNNNERRTFFMLRPDGNETFLQSLQDKILDHYEAMTAFNAPKMRGKVQVSVEATE